MAYSLSQPAKLQCPQCGRPFSAEAWLIVDSAERPDLVERIRIGTLHTATCPYGGFASLLDIALLLYRRGETPPLLFSPAQESTPEQDEMHANRLLEVLYRQLEDEWQDEWLDRGLANVPRPQLTAALSTDPEAALRQQARQSQEVLEELR